MNIVTGLTLKCICIEMLLYFRTATDDVPGHCSVCHRHLERTYRARETGAMQELGKHNLTRITNAPAEFLIQF